MITDVAMQDMAPVQRDNPTIQAISALSSVRTKLSHNKMVKTNDVYEDIANDVDKF